MLSRTISTSRARSCSAKAPKPPKPALLTRISTVRPSSSSFAARLVAGRRVGEIRRDRVGVDLVLVGELLGKRAQPHLPPRDQGHAVAALGEPSRDLLADPEEAPVTMAVEVSETDSIAPRARAYPCPSYPARVARLAAMASVALALALALATCGADDDAGEQALTAPTTAGTQPDPAGTGTTTGDEPSSTGDEGEGTDPGDPAAEEPSEDGDSAPSLETYIARADAICRDAQAEVRTSTREIEDAVEALQGGEIGRREYYRRDGRSISGGRCARASRCCGVARIAEAAWPPLGPRRVPGRYGGERTVARCPGSPAAAWSGQGGTRVRPPAGAQRQPHAPSRARLRIRNVRRRVTAGLRLRNMESEDPFGGLFGDPDELRRRMAELAEQMQGAQRVPGPTTRSSSPSR